MPCALLCVACARPIPRDADDAFRRIQRYEAEVAQGSARLDSVQACTEAKAVAEREVCEPSAALCELSLELEDADSKARCEAATNACIAARERAYAACAGSTLP